MKKIANTASDTLTEVAESALVGVSKTIDAAGDGIEQQIAPIRQSVIKRFPVLFLLAVTFGVTAVGTGIQELLLQSQLLHRSPEYILGTGLLILILTGTIYKKLG